MFKYNEFLARNDDFITSQCSLSESCFRHSHLWKFTVYFFYQNQGLSKTLPWMDEKWWRVKHRVFTKNLIQVSVLKGRYKRNVVK